jgi:endonuclease/exonuclease/phosphatase family metal-dependent hydrolase
MAFDRAALRGMRAVRAVQSWRGGGAKLASDHLPVVADIEL